MEFAEFPKIARLSRECVITEKIDGTNAQVLIVPFDQSGPIQQYEIAMRPARDGEATAFSMFAGSRTRYITPDADNHGFARWAKEHADDLWALGEGRHFGEWWGSGIQRGYGLPKGEKRFSLFNVARWHPVNGVPFESIGGDPRLPPKLSVEAPACCHVVPIISRGAFDNIDWRATMDWLARCGSHAAPGFMQPEGVVIYHVAGNTYFKKTLERDEEPKSKRAA